MINVIRGDVFAATADALVVQIDGTFVPRDAQYERLLGNIGRQFIKRFPEVDLVDEIEGQLDLPLTLGNASPIELSEGPFRIVVVVSTLFHISHLDDKYKRSVIRESFLQALRVAQQIEVKVLATAILQGGWRFTSEIAFSEMLKGYASGGAQLPDVHVYCLESTLGDRLRDVAHSLGQDCFNTIYSKEGKMKLFTIGYGGRTREDLIELLKRNGVKTLVDVRLRPDRASMGIWVKAKTADKGIEKTLLDAGIGYKSLVELGNIFLDYKDWRERYSLVLDVAGDLLTERLWHLDGPLCLMCAERRVDDCHRKQLAEYLVKKGWGEVEHIE